MKATYSAMEGRIAFEIEGANAKEVFAQIAEVQEVFDAEHQCGLCGSKDIRYNVRESEGKKNGKAQTYTYYELRCQGTINERGDLCRGRFDFGQSLDTENLFPKRTKPDGDGGNKPMPNRGWYRYVPQGAAGEQATPQTSAPRTAEAYRQKYDDGTPEGMQPSLDRLAEIFGWRTTPTRIGPALDQMREEFERNMGQPGVGKFDEMYRAFSSHPARDKVAYNALIAKLVNHWNEFRRMVA